MYWNSGGKANALITETLHQILFPLQNNEQSSKQISFKIKNKFQNKEKK